LSDNSRSNSIENLGSVLSGADLISAQNSSQSPKNATRKRKGSNAVQSPEREDKSIDFLKIRREYRNNHKELNSPDPNLKFIKREIEDLSPEKNSGEKVEKVKMRIKMLEENLKRREKLMKVGGNHNMAEEVEIGELYLDSVKAKLALLDSL
jgi:hypothetical protein